MIFKVKISDAMDQSMSEKELRKIVGDYILSRVKETGSMTVPVVNNGTTRIFQISAPKAA
tara:strand:- start:295 stop:474 length:180 start_codon:yes stop_codon:yes gene_type:complete